MDETNPVWLFRYAFFIDLCRLECSLVDTNFSFYSCSANLMTLVSTILFSVFPKMFQSIYDSYLDLSPTTALISSLVSICYSTFITHLDLFSILILIFSNYLFQITVVAIFTISVTLLKLNRSFKNQRLYSIEATLQSSLYLLYQSVQSSHF